MRTLIAAALCAGWALLGAGLAHAHQDYPNRPIKWSCRSRPADRPTAWRASFRDRLGAVLGQSIVVENRGGGAGGSIGAKFVAAADPDGYTILSRRVDRSTTGPAVHKNIGYDPAKVFTPVGLIIESPLIVPCTRTCR